MASKLNHISIKDNYQFITFRTNDSVDDYLKKIQSLNEDEKITQYKMDKYLDSSKNGTYLNDDVIDIFLDVVLEEDENLYEIEIMCIMPNHVHLLLKQLDDLSQIMRHIKGKSSKEINTFLNMQGKFWADGYFDKLIRDDDHFVKVYNYIKNNPLKVGLDLNRVFSKYEQDLNFMRH